MCLAAFSVEEAQCTRLVAEANLQSEEHDVSHNHTTNYEGGKF